MKHPFWLTECFLQHYMQSWHVNLNYEFVVTVIGKGLIVEAFHQLCKYFWLCLCLLLTILGPARSM